MEKLSKVEKPKDPVSRQDRINKAFYNKINEIVDKVNSLIRIANLQKQKEESDAS